jgi:hypothetical protein
VAYQEQSGPVIVEAKMVSKSKNKSTSKIVPQRIHGNANCMAVLNFLAAVPQIVT